MLFKILLSAIILANVNSKPVVNLDTLSSMLRQYINGATAPQDFPAGYQMPIHSQGIHVDANGMPSYYPAVPYGGYYPLSIPNSAGRSVPYVGNPAAYGRGDLRDLIESARVLGQSMVQNAVLGQSEMY